MSTKINTFPTISPSLTDFLLGTDKSDQSPDSNGETVNFTLSAVKDLFEAALDVTSMVNGPEANATADQTGLEIKGLLDTELANTRWSLIEVPAGGSTGDVLKKTTGTDYDYDWAADAGGVGVTDGDKGDISVTSTGTVWTIDNSTVTLAKMADMATDSFLGRDTAGTGAPEVLSVATVQTMLNIEDGADVTDATNVDAAGALMDADFASDGVMKRTGAGVYTTADIDLASEVTGSLSTSNLNSGVNATAATYWRGDGTWATPAGSGDVSKVGTPVDNQVGVWTGDGTLEGNSNLLWNGATLTVTGTVGATTVTASGNVTVTGNVSVADQAYGVGWNGSTDVPTKNAVYDQIESIATLSDGDKGDITLSSGGTVWSIDNNVVTFSKFQQISEDSFLGRDTAGTGNVEELTPTAVRTILNVEDGADVTDTANVTAAGALMDSEVDVDIKTLVLPADTTISTFGAALIDDADVTTARATLGVDAAGTDNSTDVTLAGEDYLSLAGQVVTANAIDLDNLSATGSPSATTFLRGDNTWAVPAGGGGGDAWGDVVDANIIPDADGTRDLGATATRFDQGYIDELHVTTGIILTEAADHPLPPAAGEAQFWVKNDATQIFYITGDDGTDNEILTSSSGLTLTDTATASGDAVPFFDSSDSDNPKVRDWSAIITDLGISTLTATETLTNKTLTAPNITDPTIEHNINSQTGTTYTLVLADQSAIVEMNNAASNTLTIPSNATAAIPVGSIVNVWMEGAGTTTIEGASGVTLKGNDGSVSAGSCDIQTRYGGATLTKVATNVWRVAGDIDTVA